MSSPTTWFYAVGTKLNVVGYRQGWYQVVDPESARRGFIYAAQYLDALRGPDETPAVVATKAPHLTQTALAEPVPAAPAKPAVKLASRATPYLLAPPPTVIPAAQTVIPSPRTSIAASRSESMASLLDRAMRR